MSVAIGDLVYEDPTDGYTAKPASSYPWTGLAATQANFAAVFVGLSTQRYDSTRAVTTLSQQVGVQDGNIRVATTGVFLMDCAAGSTFNVGDLVGPAMDPVTQALLLTQSVVLVAAKNLAVGRVERAVANAARVYVRIFSAKLGPLTN